MADKLLSPGRYRIEITITHYEDVVAEEPLSEEDLIDLAQRFGSTVDAAVDRVGD